MSLAWLIAASAACTTADAPAVGSASAELEVGPELEVEPPVSMLAWGFQTRGAAVRDGDHYLATWTDDRLQWTFPRSPTAPVVDLSLFAARVADDGTILDPGGFEVVTFSIELFWDAGVACTGTGVCLFVFGELNGGPFLATRVAGNQILDAQPFTVAPSRSLPVAGTPTQPVAWDGEKFRVVFQQAGVNVTTRIGVDGSVEPVVPVGVAGGGPVVACQGPRCLVLVTRVGAEVASFARLFDPAGPVGDLFPVPGPVAQEGEGSVHWDGTRYWLVYTLPVPGDPLLFRIHVARVSADGDLLDPDGIPITPADAHAFVAGVGTDGPRLLVSYVKYASGGSQGFLTRVTPDGVVLDPEGVPAPASVGLACGPDSCLGPFTQIVSRDFSVRALRLDGVELLDPPIIDVTTAPPGQAEASAAWTGASYAVVWRDGRPIQTSYPTQDPPSTIRGALLSPAMERIAPMEIDRQAFLSCDVSDPSVASAEGGAFVVWDACERVVGQAIGADGQPLGPPVDLDGQFTTGASPSVASSGAEYLALWDSQASSPPRAVQARRFGPPGTPRSNRFQVTANGHSPVAAFDGANYLVVWRRPLSSRESRPDLFAARMTPTGTILDADIPLATLPNIPEDAQSAACGGGVCLVAWRHAGTQVRAARIGPDGTVLDPAPIAIPVDGPVLTTATIFDGEAFLVAWREETGAMRAAQVTPGGEIVAPGAFTVSGPDPTAHRPALASNGAGHRIALYDRFDRTPGVVMRRVRARVIGAPITVPDAGVPDAAPPDAGVPDAAPPDAAPPTGDPDYVVASLGDPPAGAVSGQAFPVGVTVQNLGGPAAASSTTRFFLSVDATVGGDRALAQTSAVPPLAAGASDAQSVSLSVPTGLAAGSYFLLACADRGATVPESDDRNNCRASAATVAVSGPDLVVDAVADPPASLEVGQSFTAGDSTRNQGGAAAGSSAVAYYLSPTPTRGPGARRLSTTRPTGPLAAGGVSTGQVTVKVPSIASGTYHLVACADVSSTVAELDEQNNCGASTGTTVIAPTAR